MATSNRTYRLMVLLSPEIKAKLEDMTNELGISMSSYVAQLIGRDILTNERLTRPLMTQILDMAPQLAAEYLRQKTTLDV